MPFSSTFLCEFLISTDDRNVQKNSPIAASRQPKRVQISILLEFHFVHREHGPTWWHSTPSFSLSFERFSDSHEYCRWKSPTRASFRSHQVGELIAAHWHFALFVRHYYYVEQVQLHSIFYFQVAFSPTPVLAVPFPLNYSGSGAATVDGKSFPQKLWNHSRRSRLADCAKVRAVAFHELWVQSWPPRKKSGRNFSLRARILVRNALTFIWEKQGLQVFLTWFMAWLTYRRLLRWGLLRWVFFPHKSRE